MTHDEIDAKIDEIQIRCRALKKFAHQRELTDADHDEINVQLSELIHYSMRIGDWFRQYRPRDIEDD